MMAHAQFVFVGLMFAVAVFVALAFWAMPTWARPGIFFAVTVVPSFRDSPEAVQVLQSYRLQALAHVIVAFALIVAGAFTDLPALLILGTLWLAAGPLIAVASAHKKALPHAVAHSTIREASLTPHDVQLPGGWALQFGPFAVLAVVAIYLSAHWGQIPDEFPVHWGVDGGPNGWSARTPIGVFGPLLFGAAIMILISLVAYGVAHSARHVRFGDAPEAANNFAHRMSMVLLGVEYFLAAMFSMVGLLPLMGSPGVAPIVILALAILAAGLLLGRWVSHAHHTLPHAASMPGDGTPDACWKLGIFYYNPDDAALFVEKRIGIGYTVNFARPAAWIMLAVTVALPFGLLALVATHAKP
jgi:uncharacterized membrane protein